MVDVAVLGAGSWGTTFGKVLADGGARVTMWARRPEAAREIAESRRNTRYLPGITLPATLTATGLALLAALPAGQVRALFPHADALVQRDGHGPTTTTALRSLLQSVRQRGYAVEDGHITSGLRSVAVAVLDHSDHPVASVAVTFRSELVDDAEQERLVAAVRHAADDLSGRLHRQPRRGRST